MQREQSSSEWGRLLIFFRKKFLLIREQYATIKTDYKNFGSLFFVPKSFEEGEATMIYTVTFNPSVDYVMWVEQLKSGETNRAVREQINFGGKGINVSTVLARLGVETTALGFLAGFTGDALEVAVRESGVTAEWIRLPNGCNRINVQLKGEQETEINAQGPEITPEALEALQTRLDQLEAGDTLVLAGSVPKSVSKNIYAEILARLQGKGVHFVVDATGNLLKNVLPYHPFLIKPNRDELEELAGRALADEATIVEAARELQSLGAQNVLVSLGKDGAILLGEDGKVYRQKPFSIRCVNSVGAGDSMTAGFLAGLKEGYAKALRLGAACGAATAASSGLAEAETVLQLLNQNENL